MAETRKLFLSAVSSEFRAYRKLLTKDLQRPLLGVLTQEDFGVLGSTTLEKLDTYILACDAVIHLIGKATGAIPEEAAVAALLARHPDFVKRVPVLAKDLAKAEPGFSYTQWEAYLAIYHKRPLFIYRPTDLELDALDVPRGDAYTFCPVQTAAQRAHYKRLCDLGVDRGQFKTEERLSSAVLRDLVEILPRLEADIPVPPTRLRHTAERLIGRNDELDHLDAAWNDPRTNIVVVRAFGGMGKTSLVARWMAIMAHHGWRGAEQVYDWSFYSQGTRDEGAASADAFIEDALAAFGDPNPTKGSPWERGARLARLVGNKRCLLVLDGLEPLQYPPGPTAGKLKDPAIEALLKGLAGRNPGLCVVTTREVVTDLQSYVKATVDDFPLPPLSPLAGAALLHHAGATRAGAKLDLKPDDKELQAASKELKGHGLTLFLVGQYLRLAKHGDILQRDIVKLPKADKKHRQDRKRPYGHAFKAMEAYERWFEGGEEEELQQLAILRVLGVFDRPASTACLEALCAAPAIPSMTEPLLDLDRDDWNSAVSRLQDLSLVTELPDGSLDCHPLLREYFGMRLRENHPDAWKEAHRRLFVHLCETTKEGDTPKLPDLLPLYQAVAHGCHAGLHQEACDKVYVERIGRGEEYYSTFKLGATGSDLGAVACFFETPWSRVSPSLSAGDQSWLLSEAAFRLRALGRLADATEPMRAGLAMFVEQESWKNAARAASNLSELELTLGEVLAAVADGEQSVTYADRSDDAFMEMVSRTKHADALHHAGERGLAAARFREAEQMQVKDQPEYPRLYSVQGFQFCDLLLSASEHAAWAAVLACGDRPAESDAEVAEALREVKERAKYAQMIAKRNNWLLTIALDHLTLGRVALYRALLHGPADAPPTPDAEPWAAASAALTDTVDGLRAAGQSDYLPRGLLSRAMLRGAMGVRGDATGWADAQADLDEAWEIAERGGMRLFLADIHLHRARLFLHAPTYPWSLAPDGSARTPATDLDAARLLIETCGYGRRLPELLAAEAALVALGR